MTDPLLRAHGRGCVAQIVILGATAALVLGLGAVAVGAATLAPGEGAGRAIVFAGVFFAGTVAIVVASLGFAASRAKVLDPGFARVGVAGSGVMINLREYHGRWQGRAVDALYARRGPMLELSVEAGVRGALAVGTRTAAGEVLRGAFGMSKVRLADPAFAGLVVSSADLAAAGRAAESLPPPATPVALTSMELQSRKAPGALGVKIVAVMLALMLVLAVIGVAAMMALSSSHPTYRDPGAGAPLRRRGR